MGQTIITHFIEGTPKGIQSLQLSNKTIMGFVIPRADTKKAKDLLSELLDTPCLYLLLDDDNEGVKPKVYIGQTDDFFSRIYSHNQTKQFWTKALVFTSQAGTLNKADILFLEYLAIQKAREANVFDTKENKQVPRQPKLQRHIIDTLNDFFGDVQFIMSFIGYSVFRVAGEATDSLKLFYTKGRQSDAKGFYDENGFTVLKGSILSKETSPSFAWSEKRNKMIQEYVREENEVLILKDDYLFSSPSTAAEFCIGSSTNGWTAWKNKDGKTLDEEYRQ
ncbi:GIY-YIG nuclease family protein [Saprospira sp. CCB-QB6]|uniref:GIY-YIG nuclease family protein n=1 Tax=Saprospira sp. CCB-QB6 TaxID=3023936 RepID=UPI0023494013|nr:GIY-YIG nuclease family protein [Saprospira sp. CCB-QB6]WCL82874.1 GIY-YIG nuclease family protein [Saprospira sp. CCB-QB6]